jgi:nitronate monooxygenase
MNEKLPPLRIGQLESEFPIVLGGMSTGLTNAELAATVANEGGFGTIGGVGLGMVEGTKKRKEYFQNSQEILGQEIQDALEISNDGNIGVNLMVAATDYEELVKVSVESGAKFIASGAGLPLMLPEYVEKYRVHGQSTPELIPIVSGVRAAELILRKWKRNDVIPSAIIVETPNTAGGHLGVTKIDDIGKDEFSLENVVPQLVQTLENYGYDIPVIAAGGIWDRDDIIKSLSPKIGAKGVQMATRFVATDECNASVDFKDHHVNSTEPIVIIKSPVGMPGRAIENEFLHRVNAGEVIDLGSCVNCLKVCEHANNKLASFCIIRALYNVRVDDVDNGVMFTGSNGNRLKTDRQNGIHSAHQIMQELTRTR